MRRIVAAEVAPVPWKNGGGLTRELLRAPAGDDWGVRISVADIASDGPFSPFPGVTRWFAVLEGAGVRLRWPDRVLDVRPGDDAVQFDGADAPDCTLLDGPTRDLNVMVRRDLGSARVARAAAGLPYAPARCSGGGLFALRPLHLHGAAGAPLDLPALALAWQSSPIDTRRPWWIAPPADGAPAGDHTGGLAGYWISLHAPPAP